MTGHGAAGLPEESTGFVGRAAELGQLGELLGRARLVTVTGAGGVGKTRLALRAASLAEPRFADGVCLAELSALRDADLLPYEVAASLGLLEQDSSLSSAAEVPGGGDPGPAAAPSGGAASAPDARLEALLGYLRPRNLLLVLDTCEHLIDACAALAEAVLREAPQVTVLATSRQPLDVPGENVCPLAPLPVDASGDAVELFAQRAAASVPGFLVTDANRADVVRLCERLDGIPLAIELAAVRLRALSLPELARRLESRFPLLTGARRGSIDRHRTLRDTIGWSYELCSPADRELWARLSVFAGPFGLDAAAAVCAGGDLAAADVTETIVRLVDKSVLLREPQDGTRYRMLDTIREFGAERLAAGGQQAAVRGRHAQRYLAMAASFDTEPLASQLDSFRVLHAEHADVQAALGYVFDGPDAELAGRFAASLLWYWQISGLLREGRHWLTRALDRLPASSPCRAEVLGVRGYLAGYQGDAAAGLADTEDCLVMLARLGAGWPGSAGLAGGRELERLRARGYVYRCRALTSAGRLQEATAAGETAAGLLDATGEAGIRVVLITHQAYLDLLTGDLDGCLERCALGLRLARPEHGERWASSYLHGLTGLALFQRGELARGNVAVRTGLAMKEELGDMVGIAYGLGVLAMVAAGQGRARRAALALGAADPLWARIGSVFSGTPTMRALLDQAAAAAGAVLGDERFTRLRRDGATAPLADVLAMAADDADGLPRPAVPRGAPPARPLTSREREIAALVSEGLSNREIAEKLFISKRTVDAHIEHIFSKLDISSRLQLINWLRVHVH